MVEVALVTVLLIGAGLMIESLLRLGDVDKGFSAENVLTGLTEKNFATREDWRTFYTDVLARSQSLPGVQSAALTLLVPLTSRSSEFRVLPEEVPWEEENAQSVLYGLVSEDYFETFSIPIIRGRGFDAADRQDTERVTVIDETMAEKFWPGEDPLGKRITFDEDPTSTRENHVRLYRTVVGVARNVRHYELAQPSRMQVYAYFGQTHRAGMGLNIALKTTVPPQSLIETLRRTVNELDPDAPLYRVNTMEELISLETANTRAIGKVLLTFGGVAVTLSWLGIFGVVSYSVSRRTREIGIKMALGAEVGDVVRWITTEGAVTGAIGVIVGLVMAAGLTRVMAGLLFGVKPIEPVLYIGIAIILLFASTSAAFIPSRRAAAINPVEALKQE